MKQNSSWEASGSRRAETDRNNELDKEKRREGWTFIKPPYF